MIRDILLKENVIHGTKEHPINALHFEMGPGKEYEKGIFVQNHWHEYTEFLFIRKGCYEFQINLETMVLKEGDICIFNGGDLHQLTNLDPEACHDALLFDPRILAFQYEDQWNQDLLEPWIRQDILSINVIHPNHPVYEDLSESLDGLFRNAFDQNKHWYKKCKVHLLECVIAMEEGNCFLPVQKRISKKERKQIDRYKMVISYMEDHYQEMISLTDLAALIPCNEQYFCRFFRKISGVTPIQYLIRYRIERACQLLEYSSYNVSEIALECGFDNISYFIKRFKEIHGVSPGEYREKHK